MEMQLVQGVEEMLNTVYGEVVTAESMRTTEGTLYTYRGMHSVVSLLVKDNGACSFTVATEDATVENLTFKGLVKGLNTLYL